MEKYDSIRNVDDALKLSAVECEYFVAYLFNRQGYTTRVTPPSGDEGVDVYASNDTEKCIVQVKRYRTSKVTLDDVLKTAGAMSAQRADKAYIVTTSILTKQARNQAQKLPDLIIINKYKLNEWIKLYNTLIPIQPPPPPPSPLPLNPTFLAPDNLPIAIPFTGSAKQESIDTDLPTPLPPPPPPPPPPSLWIWAIGFVLLITFVVVASFSNVTLPLDDSVKPPNPPSTKARLIISGGTNNNPPTATTAEAVKPTKSSMSAPAPSISAEDHYIIGNQYIEESNFAAAIQEFTRAIGLKDDYAAAYFGRGAAYMSLGRYEAAISDLNKVVALKPDSDIAFLFRGTTYAEMGSTDEAIVDLTQALNLNPGLYIAYLTRGHVYLNAYEKAHAYIDLVKAYNESDDDSVRRDASEYLMQLGEGLPVAIINADDFLNVRSEPDANKDNIITRLFPGDRVRVIEANVDHSWLKVVTPQGSGWISSVLPKYSTLIWQTEPIAQNSVSVPTTTSTPLLLSTRDSAIQAAKRLAPAGDAQTALVHYVPLRTARQHLPFLFESVTLSDSHMVWLVSIWLPPDQIPPNAVSLPNTSEKPSNLFFAFGPNGEVVTKAYVASDVTNIMGWLQEAY